MVGVDRSTRGGMWTVVSNYLNDSSFCKKYNLKYIPTSITGNFIKKILFNFYAILRVFFNILLNKYDILHVHMSEKGSVFRKGIIINISRIKRSKVIIHLHGAEFEKWYNTLNIKNKNKVRKILNKGDKVLILGNYWNDFIGSIINDRKKIQVVYNAVEIPKRCNYNLESNKLLFLGEVGKRKGIFDLLDAMKIINDERKIDVHLWIYGPDSTNEIENIITKRGLNNIVDYKGYLNFQDKENIFNKIAINILPSYNEGLPMTILETMSYGIPNISTNVAAIPEVIDNSNGMILNPGDVKGLVNSIYSIILNKNLRKEKSDNSYNLIKNKFSIEKHIKEISKIYEELK